MQFDTIVQIALTASIGVNVFFFKKIFDIVEGLRKAISDLTLAVTVLQTTQTHIINDCNKCSNGFVDTLSLTQAKVEQLDLRIDKLEEAQSLVEHQLKCKKT